MSNGTAVAMGTAVAVATVVFAPSETDETILDARKAECAKMARSKNEMSPQPAAARVRYMPTSQSGFKPQSAFSNASSAVHAPAVAPSTNPEGGVELVLQHVRGAQPIFPPPASHVRAGLSDTKW